MNPKAMQKPVAYERAYDADRRVPDKTETVARTTLPASHPATSPTTKMTINPWSDRCMLFPLAFAPISAQQVSVDVCSAVLSRHRSERVFKYNVPKPSVADVAPVTSGGKLRSNCLRAFR